MWVGFGEPPGARRVLRASGAHGGTRMAQLLVANDYYYDNTWLSRCPAFFFLFFFVSTIIDGCRGSAAQFSMMAAAKSVFFGREKISRGARTHCTHGAAPTRLGELFECQRTGIAVRHLPRLRSEARRKKAHTLPRTSERESLGAYLPPPSPIRRISASFGRSLLRPQGDIRE